MREVERLVKVKVVDDVGIVQRLQRDQHVDAGPARAGGNQPQPSDPLRIAQGDVQGNTVRAGTMSEDFMAGLQALIGGEVSQYEDLLLESRKEAVSRMVAQARVLARSWRTLRELSPTDRRLLARHVGFDGAEEILEGLSRRKGGLAPAMLLRVLGNARRTDGSAVSELLAAFRDPQRRDEAIAIGTGLLLQFADFRCIAGTFAIL